MWSVTAIIIATITSFLTVCMSALFLLTCLYSESHRQAKVTLERANVTTIAIIQPQRLKLINTTCNPLPEGLLL
jgi:hypothetical protein